jgi:hypothetical protein
MSIGQGVRGMEAVIFSHDLYHLRQCLLLADIQISDIVLVLGPLIARKARGSRRSGRSLV